LFVCLGAFAEDEETKLKPSNGWDIGFNYTYHAPSKFSDVDNNINEHIFKLPVNFITSFSNENRELFSIKLGFDISFDGFYGKCVHYKPYCCLNYYFDEAPNSLLLGFNLIDVEINLSKTVGIELNLVHLNYSYTAQKTYCDSNFNLFLNYNNFHLYAGLNVYYEKTMNNKIGFNVGFTIRSMNETYKNNTKVETENETYKNNTKVETENETYKNNTKVETENETYKNNTKVETENETYKNNTKVETENENDKKGLSCKEWSNGTISFYYDGYDILIQRETGELVSSFPKEEGKHYLNFISSKLDTLTLDIKGNKIVYIINGYCAY
jgi:hypothetical protein